MEQCFWIQLKILSYAVSITTNDVHNETDTLFIAIRVILRGKAHVEWKVMLSGDRRTVNKHLASYLWCFIDAFVG